MSRVLLVLALAVAIVAAAAWSFGGIRPARAATVDEALPAADCSTLAAGIAEAELFVATRPEPAGAFVVPGSAEGEATIVIMGPGLPTLLVIYRGGCLVEARTAPP